MEETKKEPTVEERNAAASKINAKMAALTAAMGSLTEEVAARIKSMTDAEPEKPWWDGVDCPKDVPHLLMRTIIATMPLMHAANGLRGSSKMVAALSRQIINAYLKDGVVESALGGMVLADVAASLSEIHHAYVDALEMLHCDVNIMSSVMEDSPCECPLHTKYRQMINAPYGCGWW